jgi:hypothetical protein
MKTRMLPVLALGVASLISAPVLQGCYGSFNLTKKVYKWNGSLGDKWINSIVMIALTIVPVYSLAVAADAIVLNLVEFWTGSNPMAMQAGDKEIRTVTVDGKSYQITATQNRMEIAALDAPENAVALAYDPALTSWFVETPEGPRLVARMSDEALTLYHADGSRELLTR